MITNVKVIVQSAFHLLVYMDQWKYVLVINIDIYWKLKSDAKEQMLFETSCPILYLE